MAIVKITDTGIVFEFESSPDTYKDVKVAIVCNDAAHYVPYDFQNHNHVSRTLRIEIRHPVVTAQVIGLICQAWSGAKLALIGGNADLILIEDLIPDPGFYKNYLDCITATPRAHYSKPGKLAIFTHVYNEGSMLRLWESHYANYVDYSDLYVIDDGSSDGSLQFLNRRTNVVSLPRGELDHWNMANFCGYFQRFLLERYQWVIHIDCDELLISPVPLASAEFLSQLERNSIYRPERAVLVVHDRANEEAFDFSLKTAVSQQRKTIVEEGQGFLKPVLSDISTTWTPGYHSCIETTKTLANLWLVHMRFVEYRRLLNRNLTWAAINQSRLDSSFNRGVSSWSSLNRNQIEDRTAMEMEAELAKSKVFPPAWYYEVF